MVDLKDRSLADASEDYRARRRELLDAETDLRDHTETVAALRRALPPGPQLPQYALHEGPRDLADTSDARRQVNLPDLLAPRHQALVIYHMMFWPSGGCPMCSMWIDGLQGVAPHLAQHVSVAILAPAPLQVLRSWGRSRGWTRLRLVSTDGTQIGEDFGVSDGADDQMPAVTVLTRDTNNVLYHRYTAQADLATGGRGIDALSPVWNILDLTPAGRGDWWPGNDYPVDWVPLY